MAGVEKVPEFRRLVVTMKGAAAVFLGFVAGVILCLCVGPRVRTVGKSGEWQMYVRTPKCATVNNVQVVWPAKAGDPVEIECDAQ